MEFEDWQRFLTLVLLAKRKSLQKMKGAELSSTGTVLSMPWVLPWGFHRCPKELRNWVCAMSASLLVTPLWKRVRIQGAGAEISVDLFHLLLCYASIWWRQRGEIITETAPGDTLQLLMWDLEVLPISCSPLIWGSKQACVAYGLL